MNNFSKNYYRQVELLLLTLHHVSKETCFSLKGGTAINFFIQDMPRLSVDIDLTYQPLLPRDAAIKEINEAIGRIAKAIENSHPSIRAIADKSPQVIVPKLSIYQQNTVIKLEINSVFRGSVFVPEFRTLCPAAQNTFEVAIRVQTASMADLYASKFCATLNRQHPRDLFDVKMLLENQPITDEMRSAFIVYLAGYNRPFHEVLLPNIKPSDKQEQIFQDEFAGMVNQNLTYFDLAPIVSILAQTLKEQMKPNEKQFLLSLAYGEPEWEQMQFAHLKELPALQWKLQNIKNMEPVKREAALKALETCLNE